MEKSLIELLNQINKLILKFKNNFKMEITEKANFLRRCSGGATATLLHP